MIPNTQDQKHSRYAYIWVALTLCLHMSRTHAMPTYESHSRYAYIWVTLTLCPHMSRAHVIATTSTRADRLKDESPNDSHTDSQAYMQTNENCTSTVLIAPLPVRPAPDTCPNCQLYIYIYIYICLMDSFMWICIMFMDVNACLDGHHMCISAHVDACFNYQLCMYVCRMYVCRSMRISLRTYLLRPAIWKGTKCFGIGHKSRVYVCLACIYTYLSRS